MKAATLSQDELDLRKNGIGASEIAAVAGLSPFSTPLKVWREKTGRLERQSSSRSKMGQLMEPVIADWYLEREQIRSWEKPTTLIHEKYAWALATPDLICHMPDGALRRAEIKLVGWRVRPHWKQGVPDYVYAQVLWQGFVSGIQDCDVAVWFGTEDEDQFVYRCPYDEHLAETLVDIGQAFWQDHVLADVPPAVDAGKDWGEYLQSKFPRHAMPMMAAPKQAEEWVRQYVAAKEMRTEADLLELEAINHLQLIIGEHEGIEDPEGRYRVTWKSDSKGSPKWKSIAEELKPTPELIEKHMSPPPRRFAVRWKDRA